MQPVEFGMELRHEITKCKMSTWELTLAPAASLFILSVLLVRRYTLSFWACFFPLFGRLEKRDDESNFSVLVSCLVSWQIPGEQHTPHNGKAAATWRVAQRHTHGSSRQWGGHLWAPLPFPLLCGNNSHNIASVYTTKFIETFFVIKVFNILYNFGVDFDCSFFFTFSVNSQVFFKMITILIFAPQDWTQNQNKWKNK